jgi:hypothetical protein
VADERTDEHLRRRYGISRRELLRRGAIVGGTLVWTIPVISSISRAGQAAGSPLAVCCWCRPKPSMGFTGHCAPASEGIDTHSQCSLYCRREFSEFESKPEFHSAPQTSNSNQIPCEDDKGCDPHSHK